MSQSNQHGEHRRGSNLSAELSHADKGTKTIVQRPSNAWPTPWQVSELRQSKAMNPRPWHLPAVSNTGVEFQVGTTYRWIAIAVARLSYSTRVESPPEPCGAFSTRFLRTRKDEPERIVLYMAGDGSAINKDGDNGAGIFFGKELRNRVIKRWKLKERRGLGEMVAIKEPVDKYPVDVVDVRGELGVTRVLKRWEVFNLPSRRALEGPLLKATVGVVRNRSAETTFIRPKGTKAIRGTKRSSKLVIQREDTTEIRKRWLNAMNNHPRSKKVAKKSLVSATWGPEQRAKQMSYCGESGVNEEESRREAGTEPAGEDSGRTLEAEHTGGEIGIPKRRGVYRFLDVVVGRDEEVTVTGRCHFQRIWDGSATVGLYDAKRLGDDVMATPRISGCFWGNWSGVEPA
ncbi:hypothetical protein DFH06DRAFT_1133310 [Mycena polygramma]|nr:hypothetical protein DFH06DRAFT_1133310 [Mycena polygramma]